MISGHSFLLLRKNNSGEAQQPLGKYWNDYGQSTRVEEALEMVKEGRLEDARAHLRTNNVHLVTVLGAGRHGVSLDKMGAQVTGKKQKLYGKNVVHVLLTHKSEGDSEKFRKINEDNRNAAFRMNYEGANHFVGESQINTADRSALHYSNPDYNEPLLQLADTIVTSLPTSSFMEAFPPERINSFKTDAQLIVGMKSVLPDGSGVPASLYLALAKQGRFDLMFRLVFQTGLGFPEEMVGHDSPTAPIKFTLDSISPQANLDAAQFFVGDDGNINVQAGIASAKNKVFKLTQQTFLSAFLAYMKNVVSPDDGYVFCDGVIKNRKNLKAHQLEEALCKLREEDEEELVSIFLDHESKKINEERDAILAAITEGEASVEAHGKEHCELLRSYFTQRESNNTEEIKEAFRKNETGLEDLKGCTRLRHEANFLKIINTLLDSEGLAFEEAFRTFKQDLKHEVSSTNFYAGIERRIHEELARLGKISPERLIEAEEKSKNKTIEGLFANPYLDLRWGEVFASALGFVSRIRKWLHKPYQAGEASIHESGLTWQTMRVTQDYINLLKTAQGEMHRDISEEANFKSNIEKMKTYLQSLVEHFQNQQARLNSNPRTLQHLTQVNTSLIESISVLSDFQTHWDRIPSRTERLASLVTKRILTPLLGDKRRDRPVPRVRRSIAHRLDSLFIQLEKTFNLESDNLDYWSTQSSNIRWLNRELRALGILERIARQGSQE